jgi:FkbM family methyltransferase
MRTLVRRSIRALGYDLRQRRPELIDFLSAREVNLVYDVGANGGQFGASLRAHGYRGSIVSFEPANGPFTELTEKARSDTRWTAHKVALGSSPGKARLHVSKFSTYNSLLNQTQNAAAFEEASSVTHVEEVDIARLDDLCEMTASSRVFLKIDTQGFERQVLGGAESVLKAALGVLLELSIVHMYESVWMFEEAIGFMKSVGFVPAQIAPVNFLWRQDPVCVSEFDCVFRRADALLDSAV